VPANTEAEVRVPATGRVHASSRAVHQGVDGGYVIYTVPSGTHTFTARTG